LIQESIESVNANTYSIALIRVIHLMIILLFDGFLTERDSLFVIKYCMNSNKLVSELWQRCYDEE
jgi:hypothetical protein